MASKSIAAYKVEIKCLKTEIDHLKGLLAVKPLEGTTSLFARVTRARPADLPLHPAHAPRTPELRGTQARVSA